MPQFRPMLKFHCVPSKEGEYRIIDPRTATKQSYPAAAAAAAQKTPCDSGRTFSDISQPFPSPNWIFLGPKALHSQLIHKLVYSQNRFSNSLNSFGLISSLLMPSISINTPWRA